MTMEALNIKLCDTLNEFYVENDSLIDSSSQKVFVALSPASDVLITEDIAQNTKYLVPEWRSPDDELSMERIHLVLMPQRMSWICGDMPVLFYRPADDRQHLYKHLEDDLSRLFNVLHPSYRVRVMFFASLERTSAELPEARVCQMLPTDDLARYFQHTVDPDTYYYLLTKKALALSRIATPKTQIIEFGRSEIGIGDTQLDSLVHKTMEKIRARSIPFVLKTNYCAGGRGTFLVRDVAERSSLLERTAISLKADLEKLSVGNVDLSPCDVILQDMTAESDEYCVNFYVYSNGSHRISSCTRPRLSETNYWVGSTICYSQQGDLARQFGALTAQVASFLHSHNYYGPAGIDVKGYAPLKQQVVDLNPRPTASFMLGCFRNHFLDTLGYDTATLLPTMQFLGTFDTFLASFTQQLTSGQIVLTAWCTELNPTRSSFCALVGGKDEAGLQTMSNEIKIWAEDRCTR